MIHFACLSCGMKFKVKDEFAGRATKCPTCKQSLQVPDLERTQPPQGSIEGSESSLDRAGVNPGVTLANSMGSESASVESLAQKRVGRYVIDKEIARGGMGAVLRGIDRDIRREVAIKFMLNERDAKQKARFVEEAQITGQLEHPNIVPIHELGVDARKRLFFTMKMVKGRSLDQILKSLGEPNSSAAGTWSLSRLLGILVNICHALAYAHSRDVIHRDLKPANVMIGDFGEVYVMDWGLAKVLSKTDDGAKNSTSFSATRPNPSLNAAVSMNASVSTSRDAAGELTQDGSILGTPAYMPPEQALGDLDAIDQRSDLYSLGAILYAMLTLQPPIEKGGDAVAVLIRVAEGTIVPPEKRTPDRGIPPELSAIAMKALAREPKDRYQTVESFRRDIELFLEGRSVSAKRDSVREQVWKLIKRNKGVSFATAAALGILTVVVGLFTVANYAARVRAEDAFAEYQTEQNAKEEAIRRSVPALVRAGRQLANEGNIAGAREQVELALAYAPEDASALLFQGQVALAQQKWDEARIALERHLGKNPQNDDARQILRDLDHLRAEEPSTFHPLCVWLQNENLAGLAQPLLKVLAQDVQAREKLLPLYRKQIEASWPGLGSKLQFNSAGQLSLDLGPRPEIADFRCLKGIPLNVFRIRNAKVADLTPFRGMPLEVLYLDGCDRIKDLGPLRNMPLRKLWLGTSNANLPMQLENLEPLRGMKLEDLNISVSNVSSLEPLRGLPLVKLEMYLCPRVTSLEPLRGMPLERLDAGIYGFDSLEPLRGMPLKELHLHGGSRNLDLEPLSMLPLKVLRMEFNGALRDLRPLAPLQLEQVGINPSTLLPESIAVLRRMTSLKTIISPGHTLSAEEFWRRFDAGEIK